MVRLAGLSINSEDVVSYLRKEVELKGVYEKILARQIIDRVAKEREVIVTSDEIQAEADQFRYQHKLENAAQTFDWLEDQLLTPDVWESGIQERLLIKKMAESLFGQQVETYFVQNKIQYEQAVLYRLVVPYQPLAQELFYQVEEQEISFFEAAHLYDVDEQRRLACGFEGKLSRWQLRPDTAARVFGAMPREVIGVIQSEAGFELLMVEEFIDARLTAETRQNILDHLFNEWLNSEMNYLVHSATVSSTT
ncbi:MAG: peptidylprolyl isomerase [Leptolyngbyaceae cyanobacterium SM2_5_2]|nr:peptidylprolyl isomerase [Leptolyngbyaceae cyanobacterium SM2_5_2]